MPRGIVDALPKTLPVLIDRGDAVTMLPNLGGDLLRENARLGEIGVGLELCAVEATTRGGADTGTTTARCVGIR
jgi:hypothetical protein